MNWVASEVSITYFIDNQSESTIDEGKVVSEESEEVLNPRSITHPNGSFPVAEPSSLGGNRDVHVLVDHTSPTSGKVFQFSEGKYYFMDCYLIPGSGFVLIAVI